MLERNGLLKSIRTFYFIFLALMEILSNFKVIIRRELPLDKVTRGKNEKKKKSQMARK